MRITYKGDYTLKAVLDLAHNYKGGLVTINDMAKRIDAPVKFLEQVLLALKRGGFIESRRGRVGGYLLSRPPSKITVGEVVRYIDGPIEPIACANKGYTDCSDINKCVFKKLWQKVSQATSDVIDHVTFDQLVSQVDAGARELTYSI